MGIVFLGVDDYGGEGMNFKQQASEIIKTHTYDDATVLLTDKIESALLRADKEGYERGLEDAAKICEVAPQRLSPMDMSVSLREAKECA